ncbi:MULTISPECIES: single-stranded DNA-binding protein [Bifidobacterium]|uniref:Single-stranded DNA-binding protein n=3 Tax=Bifidobacterium TaxID=1678 RepID=A0A0F4L2P5_9BIFI|nr:MULTISPECIES: single-stranded DNA-binding protein [Bifidobacterium]KJY52518.1 Single-stranded DNA-binding protein [Bifidobacterium asteroides]MBI0061870.1 single-stranded DNA-binding protein [Bifidobacterium apousia]MBI0072079.1 single-stranded DNA-binding protein [Bifidobacterium sp. W8112]MBI0124715.1 single-stranded DNA-binding protein [Bifidobacterium apousia]MBI0136750.1 single-stranded DNA-binding protein [Bifidobacterium sp. W8120]
MAGDTYITVVGNLTADPEVRTTSNGGTVANLTIASTPRQFNRNSGQWEDGDSLFMRCSAWDSTYSPMASNIQASLTKGMRVIAQGRLVQRSYQDREGNNRTVVELRLDEIGPALTRNTAQVTRNANTGGGGSRGGFAGSNNGGYQGGASYQGGAGAASAPMGRQQPAQSQQAPAQDPWSSTGSGDSFGSFGSTGEFGGSGDDPEF